MRLERVQTIRRDTLTLHSTDNDDDDDDEEMKEEQKKNKKNNKRSVAIDYFRLDDITMAESPKSIHAP